MFRRAVLLAAGCLLLTAPDVHAQDAVLAEMYGNGVHSYFAQDYKEAFEELNTAIVSGLKDPRAFYFRGLTYEQLGRDAEAEMDFERGAELEAEDPNSERLNIARSLERVQGSVRLELEKYRTKARMIALTREEEARRKRYEQIQAAEPRVVREVEEPGGVEPAGAVEPAAEGPFGAGPAPEPAEPVKSGDPLNTMARRVPPSSGSFILLIMCCRKSSEPSLILGRPAPNRPPNPCSSCSRLMTSASASHLTPNGGLASM